MKTEVGLIEENRRVTDVFFVVHRESGIGLCTGHGGKTLCTDGVEGTVSIVSVRKKDDCRSGHRAGSFWLRLKRSLSRRGCRVLHILGNASV